MRVIEPLTVADDNLVSASIAEDDAPSYTQFDTYNIGDQVIDDLVHAVFESVVDGNLGNRPSQDDGSNWVLVSATNRWSVFDRQIDNPAVAADQISYVLTFDDLVGGIAVFGLLGSALTLQISNGENTATYERKLSTQSNLSGWFNYFFGGFEAVETAVFLDLPFYGPGTIYTFTVTPIDGQAEIGQIVLGKVRDLGNTRWQSEVSVISGSTRERNVFLDFILVKRATALRVKFRVVVLNSSVSKITSLIQSYDVTPAVWIGDADDRYGLIVYGLPFDYVHTVQTDVMTEYTLAIEGLK